MLDNICCLLHSSFRCSTTEKLVRNAHGHYTIYYSKSKGKRAWWCALNKYAFLILRLFSVDDIPPVIQNCPDDISQNTPLGSGGRIMTWTSPTATDNSGVVTLASRSHRSGQFFATGTTTVTYRFVDASGNEAICSINIVIVEGRIRLSDDLIWSIANPLYCEDLGVQYTWPLPFT